MANQKKIIFRLALLHLLLVACFDFSLIFQKREIQDAENLNTRSASYYVTHSFFSRSIKSSQHSNSKVLFVGDSYAQDFMNALLAEQILDLQNIDTIHISAACGINFDPAEFVESIPAVHRQNCISKGGLSRFEYLLKNYELLFLASKWEAWHIDELEEVILRLEPSETKRIIIVGSKYLIKPDLRMLSGRGRGKLDADLGVSLQNGPRYAKQNELRLKELARKIEGVHYVNIAKYFEANGSNETIKNSSLLTFDGYHLTKAGAKYLGRKIKSDHVLPCTDLGQVLVQCGKDR